MWITLPFLDTEIHHLKNGKLDVKVHRNVSHANKYLAYNSHNPPKDKKVVVNTLLHRADVISSTNELKKS